MTDVDIEIIGGGGAAKSMDDLGPVFGDDLTGAEVRYLMKEEFARFADDILWRRSNLGLTMSRQDRGALATFIERCRTDSKSSIIPPDWPAASHPPHSGEG